MLIESREIDPRSSLQEPKAAWAGVWHLWTVILPRRSITGRLVFGKVWRRYDEGGKLAGDVVSLANDRQQGQPLLRPVMRANPTTIFMA